MEILYVFVFCLAIVAVLWGMGKVIDWVRKSRQDYETYRSDYWTWQMTHPHDDHRHDEDPRL